MTKSDDDNEKSGFVWPHPGDLGTIFIAGIFLVGTIAAVLFIFSSPEPVRDLMGHKNEKPQPNEVTVTLPAK